MRSARSRVWAIARALFSSVPLAQAAACSAVLPKSMCRLVRRCEAEVVGGIEVPDLVHRRPGRRPLGLGGQQVVALGDHDLHVPRDRDGRRDGFLHRPDVAGCVDDGLVPLVQPADEVGVAGGVEGVDGTLAVLQRRSPDHRVREVEPVHRNHHHPVRVQRFGDGGDHGGLPRSGRTGQTRG